MWANSWVRCRRIRARSPFAGSAFADCTATTEAFRPKLQPAHHLGPGRAMSIHRRFIYQRQRLDPVHQAGGVFEVPGDHDSMVLEPNVRVLAAKLRQCIEAAEQAHQAGKDRDQGTGNGAGEGRREAEANGDPAFGTARTAPAMA